MTANRSVRSRPANARGRYRIRQKTRLREQQRAAVRLDGIGHDGSAGCRAHQCRARPFEERHQDGAAESVPRRHLGDRNDAIRRVQSEDGFGEPGVPVNDVLMAVHDQLRTPRAAGAEQAVGVAGRMFVHDPIELPFAR